MLILKIGICLTQNISLSVDKFGPVVLRVTMLEGGEFVSSPSGKINYHVSYDQAQGERLFSLAVLCIHCTAELLLHFILRSSAVHSVQKFGCTEYKLYNHTELGGSKIQKYGKN